MSYLKDREIWLSNVPTGNPPSGYFWKFIQNGKVVVRDSSGNNQMMIATSGSQAITGSLTVTEGITGTVSSASYVEYSGVANKPTLVSGSSQITYSGLTGVPSGIVSGSGQVAQFGYATTGSNGFNGSQSITGSLTVTGQVIAQTLNVQQVTSSIVYSSGSNIFGNSLSNTQQFTGSLSVSGSITSTSTMTGTNFVTNGTTLYGVTLKGRSSDNYGAIGYYSSDGLTRYGYIQSHSTNGGQLNITSDGGGQIIMDNRGVVVTSALSGSAATFSGDLSVVTLGSTSVLVDGTNPTITLRRSNNGNASSAINFKGSTAIKWQIGTNQSTGLGFEINEGDATANKFYIAPGGSATFNNTETTLNFNPQTNLLASYYYLNFGGGSIMYRNTTDIYFGSNAKYGSAGTVVANYTSANGMGLLTMDGGALRWQANNTSVTAGTAYGVPIRFAINGDGNVGIGTATPNLSAGAAGSTILTVSATTSGRNGVIELNGTRTNSTDISGYVRFFNNGAATPLADIRAIRGSSDTSGDLAFTTANTEQVRITSDGNVLVGETSPPSFSTPNGGKLLMLPNAVIVSGVIALGSPYTQNIQIDIVYNNWGGNNVIGLVDMIITLREFANIAGTAFGKVFAVNGGSGATFTSFNTTNITVSQCSVTATSGGNYTLRITIDPSNVTDRGSFYLTIPNAGGTGSSINSIIVSYV